MDSAQIGFDDPKAMLAQCIVPWGLNNLFGGQLGCERQTFHPLAKWYSYSLRQLHGGFHRLQIGCCFGGHCKCRGGVFIANGAFRLFAFGDELPTNRVLKTAVADTVQAVVLISFERLGHQFTRYIGMRNQEVKEVANGVFYALVVHEIVQSLDESVAVFVMVSARWIDVMQIVAGKSFEFGSGAFNGVFGGVLTDWTVRGHGKSMPIG